MADDSLNGWTIYDHPLDYPNQFVARRWDFLTGKPSTEIIVADSLAELRTYFASIGLVTMLRQPEDDSVIIETWI
jgi:hypothetical protein